jgi:ParB family chromosome partitioning protein
MVEIPLTKIENFIESRLAYSDIDDIANSLSKLGQLAPILLRPHPTIEGKFQIIYGNRRVAAARRLGWNTISSTVTEMSDTEAMIRAFSENIDRKDLSDYEIALFLEKLHVSSLKTYAELSELVQKSKAYISQHIAMLHLFPESVGTEIERSKVLRALTERHARALIKIEGTNERWNTAKLAVSAGLDVREIERMCSALSRRRKSDPSGNQRTEVQSVIAKVFSQLGRTEPISHFQSMSDDFTMLARLQPFYEMGKDEAVDHIRKLMSAVPGGTFKVTCMNCRFVGDVVIATIFSSRSMIISRKKISSKFRTTMVLRKEGDNWKIIHEHWSSADGEEMFSNIIRKLKSISDRRSPDRTSSAELKKLARYQQS